eukprot:scaffold14979_cov93-Cyclotella_meneghiniana.AAC.2
MGRVNAGKDKLHIALQLTSMNDSANIRLLYFRGYGVVMEFDGRKIDYGEGEGLQFTMDVDKWSAGGMSGMVVALVDVEEGRH